VNVGLKVGKISFARSAVDEKGRIILPKAIRTHLGLSEGSEVVVRLEKEKIVVSRAVEPDEFIRDMEGFVKDDSPLPLVDPLSLKRIWEKA
jgi:AbrB family looped-hinge helix DNA binding protein